MKDLLWFSFCIFNNDNDNNNNNNNNNKNNHWLVEYNTNSYNKNCNIANNFQSNPRRQVYCFVCKIALRPFTFNNSAILRHADYGAAVKLEITFMGEVPRANFTLKLITVPRLYFAVKRLKWRTVFYFRG